MFSNIVFEESTVFCDTTPSACEKNYLELGVSTPREDDLRVFPDEGSDVPIRPLSLTSEWLQASGVVVVSAQSSGKNYAKNSSLEKSTAVPGKNVVYNQDI